MKNKRNITFAAATLLLLVGCSAAPETEPEAQEPSSSPEVEVESQESSEQASAEPAETPPESGAADPNVVTVTLGDDPQDITFTDAYCSGPSGDIRNIIGKVNNGLPLLKVSNSDHVLLKMGNEKPYEGRVSEGLSVQDEMVTFDDVSLDGAVIDGTLQCTSWD